MSKHRDGAEQRDFNSRWTHGGNKFVIGTIHGDPIEIIAQYNPKELARQAAATWTPHPNTSAKYSPSGESKMWSEYGTTAPRTLTVELLFDGYEEGISIAPIVEDLERLTIPVDLGSRDKTKRRPQLCVAVWGKQQLRCVVTSVATKLTMFDDSGLPLRATCTVVLTEVDVVAMMKSDVHRAIDDVAQKSGNRASIKPGHELPYPPEDSKPTRVPPPNRTPSDGAAAGKSSAPAAATAKPAPSPAASAPAPAAAPAAAAPAPAAASGSSPSNTVGTPSAKIDPAALDGAEPGSGPLFAEDPPASNSVGTPSAQVDPNALDGEGDHVFTREQPAADATSSADAGTADPKYKAAAEDLQ